MKARVVSEGHVKDLRFELELIDFKEFALKSSFKTFFEADAIKTVIVDNADLFTRKKIDNLTDIAKTYGARGLAWFKVGDNELSGGISKFFDDDLALEMIETLNLSENDILFIVAVRPWLAEAAARASSGGWAGGASSGMGVTLCRY